MAEVFSFHLARVDALTGASALLRGPDSSRVAGLIRAEAMAGMRLGAPVVSPDRMQVRNLAVFAQWVEESALESFLEADRLGRVLASGWHVRMEFVRRWGEVAEFAHLPELAGRMAPSEPVVAVTLARTRLPELARFIEWGRPVERQVRDDPAATLALAAMRPPRTFSTFSIWRSNREMTDMVFGRQHAVGASSSARSHRVAGQDVHVPHLEVHDPDAVRRHVEAMEERGRRDFHREFTTLRFRPLSEHGSWDGRTALVPGLSPS